MELLAPAGSLEAFAAAVDAGADAVYIGAPALNARALARHFTLAEIAAMIDHGHRHGVKVYAAMNSLLKEGEIPVAVELLAALEALRIDALIIQDLGIYYLARRYFPALRLHASTLLGAHNALAVRQFVEMGFSRVVLARENTLAEISEFHRQSPVELEVFVHGAMCFSYSGLCLFSSYLGGKSGLRGRCVQPCRRKYAWAGRGAGGKQGGYLFSMNDLEAIELVPRLREAGVGSLKIEGRMKSGHYVGSVVRAYRLVLDAETGDQAAALAEARKLLDGAMGRKSSTGYFLSPRPQELLSPHHSGNIGRFLGRIDRAAAGKRAGLVLKAPVRVGDRLRLHQEKSGERHPFTLKEIRMGGAPVDSAGTGMRVSLALPAGAGSGDSLYKVDVRDRRVAALAGRGPRPERFRKKTARLLDRQRLAQIIADLHHSSSPPRRQRPAGDRGQGRSRQRRFGPGGGGSKRLAMAWWLKIDDLLILKQHLPLLPDRIVVVLTPETYARFQRVRRHLAPLLDIMVWALPPVIEQSRLGFFQDAVTRLRRSGFRQWQIGHLGQLQLFSDRRQLVLYGDYTLNALNSLALRTLAGLGLKNAQAAIETDRHNLLALEDHRPDLATGLTVYGLPPLFTARSRAEYFQYNRRFVSPRGESFVLRQEGEGSVALPDRPFSLLPAMDELRRTGLDYVVVDLSRLRLRKGDLVELFRRIRHPDRQKRAATFNYYGTLQ